MKFFTRNNPLLSNASRYSSFNRFASNYYHAAVLPRQIEQNLLESLEYFENPNPSIILDIGCGTGHATAILKKRYPKAQVIGVDIAINSLKIAKSYTPWWKSYQLICADIQALPLPNQSVDMVFSNLCLPWSVPYLSNVFSEFRRILRPNGFLLCSTLGNDTFFELQQLIPTVINQQPVSSPFISISQMGDILLKSGFKNPVLDRDHYTVTYPKLQAFLKEIQYLGLLQLSPNKIKSFIAKKYFKLLEDAYLAEYSDKQKLITTWESIYFHAWAPEINTPIRSNMTEVVSMPIQSIPIRRKN